MIRMMTPSLSTELITIFVIDHSSNNINFACALPNIIIIIIEVIMIVINSIIFNS